MNILLSSGNERSITLRRRGRDSMYRRRNDLPNKLIDNVALVIEN
jgi:hypothetical protein